mmetsp:Transcript_62184/g.98925  ORF Transcript_62184/g.98925 Transcript_62184/m.98925 type:complete len:275 (+) Transcript_62184:79-903(+)
MAPTFPFFLASIIGIISMYHAHGQDYECSEREECVDSSYTATIGDKLICSAPVSCGYSAFTLTCSSSECEVECTNDDSCYSALIVLDNAKKVVCKGHESCQDIELYLNVAEGFELDCQDSKACYNVEMAATGYVDKIKCDAFQACYSFDFDIAISDDFELECKGDNSCQNGQLLVNIAADTDMEAIKCEGAESCQNMDIDIQGTGSEALVIDELKCEGHQSCKDMTITVQDATLIIKKCICDSSYACVCTQGLEVCEELDGYWNADGSDTYYDC